jgi:2'-hydroxyisoflavone reductase
MSKSLNVLVLGGTGFLGSWIVRSALARGHAVSVLNRGHAGAPPARATALRADRNDPGQVAAALAGNQFDVVIDGSGYAPDPATVGVVARQLPDVSSYVFVSSVAVYSEWPAKPILSESDPVWTEGEGYGPGKAGCERALAEILPGRVLSVRPGEIVGPRDNGGQLTGLLERIARGGQVVGPGDPDLPVAMIDARDLAEFCVLGAENGWSGPVNVTGAPGQTTMRELYETCRKVTGSDAEIVWVPSDVLTDNGVMSWNDLPFFVPTGQMPGVFEVNVDRARELGLLARSVTQTVTDTWEWQRTLDEVPMLPGFPKPGIAAEREQQLIAISR